MKGRFKKLLVPLVSATALGVAGACLLLLGSSQEPAHAEENIVRLPVLDQFMLYKTVEHGSVKERLLWTREETLEAAKIGALFPVGTQHVMLEYEDGKPYRYLVSQKTGEGPGDWQFQSFSLDQSVRREDNTARCYACHQAREDRQFMFSFSDARRFSK